MILSDSDDDSKPASTPKAFSDLVVRRASRAILVRIVAFAKATPEEHLAPESPLLLLLLLGRAIHMQNRIENPFGAQRGGQTRSKFHASDSAQNQLRIASELKAESLTVTASNDILGSEASGPLGAP